MEIKGSDSSLEESLLQMNDSLKKSTSELTEDSNISLPAEERIIEDRILFRKKFKPRGWIIVQRKILDEPIIPSYSTKRLVEAFTKAGFEMEIINALNVDVYLTDDDRKSVLVNGKVRRLPTFVLARTGAKTDFYTLAVYRHLEKLDVPVMNASQGIEDVKDKLYCLQILAQNNIAVPKTILLKFPVNVKYVTKRLGLPIIIKLLNGMQGQGVFMAKTEAELQTYCDMLEAVSPNARMIFQECITRSLGRDLRVLVVGGKVIGAMLRTNDKDFRANIHRGAEGSLYKLPPTAEYLALSAARVLNLDIAGVDLLFDDEQGTKFRICEVNSSPGFEGFEKATGTDVPEHLILYVCLKCNIPLEVLAEMSRGGITIPIPETTQIPDEPIQTKNESTQVHHEPSGNGHTHDK